MSAILYIDGEAVKVPSGFRKIPEKPGEGSAGYSPLPLGIEEQGPVG
ncbi:MAG: hypothetical protein PHS95_03610 [Candidatus Pacebacteria bacterium]|nr:hypothetical protein [Candidatus Paceibacterota bacterium]